MRDDTEGSFAEAYLIPRRQRRQANVLLNVGAVHEGQVDGLRGAPAESEP